MEAIIKFKNGDEITAEVNGSCYVVDKKPSIPKDLTDVTITENGQGTTIEDAIFVECASVDNRYWFTLIEKPENQKQAEEIALLKADNAMLTECILEMSEVVYGDDM